MPEVVGSAVYELDLDRRRFQAGLKAGERVIVSNGSAVALGQQVKAVAATTAQLAAMPAVDPNGNTDEKSH